MCLVTVMRIVLSYEVRLKCCYDADADDGEAKGATIARLSFFEKTDELKLTVTEYLNTRQMVSHSRFPFLD